MVCADSGHAQCRKAPKLWLSARPVTTILRCQIHGGLARSMSLSVLCVMEALSTYLKLSTSFVCGIKENLTPTVLHFSSGGWYSQSDEDEHQRSVGGRGKRPERSLPLHPRQNNRPPESRWVWMTWTPTNQPFYSDTQNAGCLHPVCQCHHGYALACLKLYRSAPCYCHANHRAAFWLFTATDLTKLLHRQLGYSLVCGFCLYVL